MDLSLPDLAPEGWATDAFPPSVTSTDISVYELHIRDFSASDSTVPERMRGKYGAFALVSTILCFLCFFHYYFLNFLVRILSIRALNRYGRVCEGMHACKNEWQKCRNWIGHLLSIFLFVL